MSGSPEKVERNRNLYKDYKKGMSYTDLVVKYKIAQSVVFNIIKREKGRIAQREVYKNIDKALKLFEEKEN